MKTSKIAKTKQKLILSQFFFIENESKFFGNRKRQFFNLNLISCNDADNCTDDNSTDDNSTDDNDADHHASVDGNDDDVIEKS